MISPIRYPLVLLNGSGQQYRFKYGMAAIRKMKEWGVPSDKPADAEAGWDTLSAQVAAASYIEDDNGKLKGAGLTAKDVKAAYDDDPDLADMDYLRGKLDQAITFRMASEESSQPETAPLS